MSNIQFNHVLLCTRSNTKKIQQTLEWAEKQLLAFNIKVTVQIQPGHLHKIQKTTTNEPPFDLVLVVGGDGSLLHAAQSALHYDIPIIGIHRGQLGFLTDLPPDDPQALKAILEGEYICQTRNFLSVDYVSEKKHRSENALNDVVLLPGDAIHMLEFDTYINQQLVYKNRSSGMIISTPTGSTAYSLSAGGPILHPSLDAISLIPMFPHTLSSRPLVIQGSSSIKIMLDPTDINPPILTCDGREKIHLDIGSSITLKQHQKKLQLLHPKDYHYYNRLHEKLGWEKRHKRM
jgi:NAD+ kinase